MRCAQSLDGDLQPLFALQLPVRNSDSTAIELINLVFTTGYHAARGGYYPKKDCRRTAGIKEAPDAARCNAIGLEGK